jgi:cell division protein FtsI/penicillin-binding protein 2
VTPDAAPPRSRPQRGGAHRAPRAAPPNIRPGKARDPAEPGAAKTPGIPNFGSKAGAFGLGRRTRKLIARASAVVVLAALVGVGLVRPGVPSAEPTVTQFLLAWESRHYLQAAQMTTGQPKAVATELASAYERLDAADLDLTLRGVSQHGRTAEAAFGVSIDLSSSGLTWTYDNHFGLTDGRHGWRVQWSPSVIVPGMTSSEQLAVVTSWNPRSQLLDSAGQPLGVWSKVYRVGVVPDRLTDADETAADLAKITLIPKDQIEGQMDQGLSAAFLPLLTLSPTDYKSLRSKLSRIPGLLIEPRRERLFDSIAPDVVGSVGTETASILRLDGMQYRPGTTVGLSGLQQAYQRQLTGTPQTEVILQRSGIAVGNPLRIWAGTAGKPVHTTLDATVQVAADQALADNSASGAIVAVQAGTGKILAVASRTAHGMPSISPLAGRYEPGQAFTIISSAAILSAERLSPDAVVPCPPSNPVDGVTFRNDPPVTGLKANASFRSDFAHACSTAFAGGLAQDLSASDLSKTSQEFGVGGWRLPGSNFFAGQLGQPVGLAGVAGDMIGVGSVRMSPLGMALAASVVDSGSWHSPSLVSGMTDSSAVSRTAASPAVLSQLRSLMLQAASTGANAVADVGRDVGAQQGSAPYGSGRLWLNWFVGYRADVAFAVVEVSKSPATSAAALASSFLQDIPPGG